VRRTARASASRHVPSPDRPRAARHRTLTRALRGAQTFRHGAENDLSACQSRKEILMPDLIWIVVVVLVVLFLFGYFGRGRFRR
jgi:hypothetical protein